MLNAPTLLSMYRKRLWDIPLAKQCRRSRRKKPAARGQRAGRNGRSKDPTGPGKGEKRVRIQREGIPWKRSVYRGKAYHGKEGQYIEGKQYYGKGQFIEGRHTMEMRVRTKREDIRWKTKSNQSAMGIDSNSFCI